MRALFEMCLNKNYTDLCIISLKWCKYIDKWMSPSGHELRQFTEDCNKGLLTNHSSEIPKSGYLPGYVCYQLESNKISLAQLFEPTEQGNIRRLISEK